MNLFSSLTLLPPDPILGLQDMFRIDPNPAKINLSIGTLTHDHGLPHCFRSVQTARNILLNKAPQFGYAPLGGEESFKNAIRQLLFSDQKTYIHQAVGGTGALFHIFSLLKRVGIETVYITQPAWPNYANIANMISIEQKHIPHASQSGAFDFSSFQKTLASATKNEAILVQFSCHNPTGIDLSTDEWDAIIALLEKTGCTLILDMAYLGFSSSLQEECYVLQTLKRHNIPYFIAVSFSKSLGLYGERVGAVVRVSQDADELQKVGSHLKQISRSTHSSTPRFGALLTAEVLSTPALRGQWEEELAEIRASFISTRSRIASACAPYLSEASLFQLKHGKGLFWTIGWSKECVHRLREYGIWCTDDGRMNIGALRPHLLPQFVSAVRAVGQETL